ncbi:unnamed protein product [Linum trigynum]|uniref:Uncharacterized protein n=1 Tax=Linum trigynum TaxID=586398 RepID=A0AAV2F848_9ROSI
MNQLALVIICIRAQTSLLKQTALVEGKKKPAVDTPRSVSPPSSPLAYFEDSNNHETSRGNDGALPFPLDLITRWQIIHSTSCLLLAGDNNNREIPLPTVITRRRASLLEGTICSAIDDSNNTDTSLLKQAALAVGGVICSVSLWTVAPLCFDFPSLESKLLSVEK